tara:strand:+ start:4717 stop:5949 length:1233 start_codon:yes stop_codon:yes gene_type:complete
MRIENNPFSKDTRYEECKSKAISLDEAKTMIPRVSYVQFFKACKIACLPQYLHDVYYMHYLCILGNMVRLRNFVLDLEDRGLSPMKVVNYTLLPEFNFGTCLHTTLWWNDDPNIFIFLRQQCGGDCRLEDMIGMEPSDYNNLNYSVYTNPFSNILGDGNLVFDKFELYLRQNNDFRRMMRYLCNLRRELEEDEREVENEQEDIPGLVEVEAFDEIHQNENNNPENGEGYGEHVDMGVRFVHQDLLSRQPAVQYNFQDEEEFVQRQPVVRQLDAQFEEEKEEKEEIMIGNIRLQIESEELLPPQVIVGEPMDIDHMETQDLSELIHLPVENKIYYDIEKVVNKMEVNNDVVNNVVFAFMEIGLKNEEDIITPHFDNDELVDVGVLDEQTIDKIWKYIETHSPNFVHGDWIN